MVDTGMGGALYTYLAPDELCTTIEIKIIYLYATSAGRLICETRVIQRSKRIAVLESEVKQNSTLIAKATGTFYIFKSKGEGEDQRESKPSDLP
jgi:acyl-CoA thioesterase